MNWLNLGIGAAAGIMLAHIFIIFFRGFENIIMTPEDIRHWTNLNTFGQWVVYIIISIFSPVIFICKMIYLLMHIGRRSSYRNYNNFSDSNSSNVFEDDN